MSKHIGKTYSLCPECLKRIPAKKVAENNNVYLEKTCPEHGSYKTLIWRNSADDFLSWSVNSQEVGKPLKALSPVASGCPYDCGLCLDHRANACTMIMEVTQKCNLHCPVCFADTKKREDSDPSLKTIESMYETVLSAVGTPTVQLSGGEPTLRDDLPEIVALGKTMGLQHIMVNTNGLRIAEDSKYLDRLVKSGLDTVFLQFDGVTDDVYRHIRNFDFTRRKIDAIRHCSEANVGVILVPTIVPGINDHQLGDIVRFAKEWIPTVRGIHFQPVSYLGRYPTPPDDSARITIPDLLDRLVSQTNAELKTENFIPRGSHDSHCSFSSLFILDDNRKLMPVSRRPNSDTITRGHHRLRTPWEKARSFMRLHWNTVSGTSDSSWSCCENESNGHSLSDIFNRTKTKGLAITSMPFQDIWNLDLERLKSCCNHVVTPTKKIVPFCAYYLTDIHGKRLYACGTADAIVMKDPQVQSIRSS